MQRPDRGSIEAYQAPALEHAIDDRLPEILVMQDAAPCLQCLVRGEDHRAMPTMPLVDHVKEHVGGIRAVREIPHLVDDQDGWMRIGLQGVGELPRAKRR